MKNEINWEYKITRYFEFNKYIVNLNCSYIVLFNRIFK